MTTAGAFSRANGRLFTHFREEAATFLRGAEPVDAILTENVELIGDHGEVAQVVTTATLPTAAAARVGDRLDVGAKAWTLDRLLRHSAGAVEFVIRPGPPAP